MDLHRRKHLTPPLTHSPEGKWNSNSPPPKKAHIHVRDILFIMTYGVFTQARRIAAV